MKTVLADFEPLRPAEAELVKELQKGNRKTTEISGGVPDDKNKTLNLRATFIRYLALGGCEDCRLPETGLRVAGAYIDGDEENSEDTKGLDLEGATLPHDLGLFDCRIPDPIILRSAKIKNFFLNGSDVKAEIMADGLQTEGSISLGSTTIGGEVRLLGAKLGGSLDCDGSNLKAENKALSCDGMQAEGGVFLRKATIEGKVRLLGARLGGNLSCIGAALQAKGNALSCDRMRVEGSVFLSGATIAGEVRLLGARLGGNLDCEGAKLQAVNDALCCDGAKVAGAFFWREGAEASGCIDLNDASFGSICDDRASWPPELRLDRCRYGAFLGGSPTDAQGRIDWLALQQPKKYGQDFWPDPYEHCAKVLREMGHGADAREILIEKERLQRMADRAREERELVALRGKVAEPLERTKAFKRKAKIAYGAARLWAKRKWDNALGFLVGYGRKPLDALWRGLLPMWVFGTVAFFLVSWMGEIKPNLPQIQVHPSWVECAEYGARRWASHTTQVACFRAQPEGESYPHFNALFYSADTLFPVVSLEMQSYWIPDDTKPFGMLARWYLWFHIAMGWALTLLAVAGFSGLIKTDNTK